MAELAHSTCTILKELPQINESYYCMLNTIRDQSKGQRNAKNKGTRGTLKRARLLPVNNPISQADANISTESIWFTTPSKLLVYMVFLIVSLNRQYGGHELSCLHHYEYSCAQEQILCLLPKKKCKHYFIKTRTQSSILERQLKYWKM